MPGYLVTGANGQLGSELMSVLGESAIGITCQECDLTDPGVVDRVITRSNVEFLINCAAYTAVDLAEQEPQLCRQVNQDAVEAMVRVCQDRGVRLVQLSTDYVFDTNAIAIPLKETDTATPAGVYAQTKLAGENAALENQNNLVIRTCGLYTAAPGRENFVRTMLRLAKERDVVRVVDDQTCCPSYARHVARAVVFLAEKDACGIFNVVNTGAMTWFQFAREIFRQANIDICVEAITTEEFGAAAPRPRYSVLDTEKYHTAGGPPMPTIEEGLAAFFRAQDTIQ